MDNSEYIKKYINFHTSTKVINRGRKLYKTGKVSYINYNPITDGYNFEVKGSRLYDVVIKRLSKRDISTYCTCPYDWGRVCKHTVAALLFLSENVDNLFEAEKTTNVEKLVVREANQAIVLNSFIISDSIIKQNCSPTTFASAKHSDFEIVDVKFAKDSVSFELHRGYYYNAYTCKVVFKNKDGNLEISTNENTRINANNLKQSEVFCLQSLVNTNNHDLFEVVFTNKLKEYKKNYLSNFGLELKDFDKYFKVDFSVQKGFVFTNKPEGYGLLPINSQNNGLVGFINKLSDKTNEVLIKKKPKSEFSLGFVLHHDNISNQDIYYYKIIVAKLNKAKTRLISKFEEYSADIHNGIIKISNEQQQIIDLINKYEYSEGKEDFLLSKTIFNLLAKQKFVFYNELFNSRYKMVARDFDEINLSDQTISIILDLYEDKQFVGAKLKYKVDNLPYNEYDINYSDNKILSINKTLHHIKTYEESFMLQNFVDDVKIVKQHKDVFFNNVIKPLSENFEINFNDVINSKKVELDFKSRQIYLSEQDDFIVMKPQVVYDNNVSVLLLNQANPIKKDEETNGIIEYERNHELENDFIDLIASLHPNFEEQKVGKLFYLDVEDFTKKLWFYDFFDNLNKENIEIYGLKNLKNFKYSPHKGKITTSIKSGQDWFDIEVNISFGDNIVGLSDIRKAVINKQKYIQLKDGSVGILPEEWLHKLEKYFRNGTVKKDKLEISKLRFSIIDELFDDIDETEIIQELAEKRKRLSEFKEINKTKVPKQITAELRHYQKEGLNWLNFLDEMKWGGILADDMGLGKTLQILTFIQHILVKDKTPNLIVVPTTLLFNWKAEIEKFAPKIKAFYHYGINREKDTKKFNKHNIIFTSYGVLLRDIEFLSKFQFNYIILDESQAIKNPASRRYKAANLIKAKNRIALTGTPIENSTFDLFAQMSFANPGIFGSINNFKENYSNPIDKEANETVANELQQVINPFLLRRTKENVATELPDKTEDVIYCEMEPEQRTVYDAYRNEYRNKLLNNVETEGIGKSKIMVLEALTRLRQICDSPALIKTEDYTSQSIKVKEIINHITQKTAKHKVLVFSQFVGMLGLIKEQLEILNISYEYLDGKSSSKKREESVNHFQNNNDLRVFLISLKAGGTGLNLTAADYVYIVDPWWNPAVENQAIDRCYRIGQDKKVFAYRMICKNTVEEKILDLQTKKKKIATDIIQTDENIMKTLDVSDIKNLFG